MLCYFIFIHLFFHPNDPPEIGKRIRRYVKKKEGGLTPLSMRGIFLVAIYVFNSAVSWCEAWN